MRGDFSRIRFAPRRNYTEVLQQQGRVALDADQNEQAAIDAYLRDTELTDVVGPYGGPIDDAGFDITVVGANLRIGRGRYYVYGLLCENDKILNYNHQPYLLNLSASETSGELLTELRRGGYTAIRVYLEVWQRFVTALDDACLREPALGQADTTGRLQTVWRVVAEGIPAKQPPSRGRLGLPQAFTDRFPTFEETSRFVVSEEATTEEALAPGDVIGNLPIEESCCAEMYRPVLLPRGGRMSAQTTGAGADCTCEPTPAAGYRGLENQLYRVEIHQGGDETTATFKWSRENGSVVSAVTNASGSVLTVDSLGPDAYLGFGPNQWVEVYDDTYLFGIPPNQPGELVQIQNVTPEELTITLDQPAPSVNPEQNARVRRWEQIGASAGPNGVPLSAGTWIDLEYGIQIQFTAGHYNPGDYWLIPARTASGQIDWPPCDSADGAPFQPAQTITVYRAPLACLEAEREKIIKHDCRRLFSPLTALTPSAAATAMHVTKFSWTNDDVWTLDQLIANGLVVTLDQAPTGQIDAATFAVTVEVPALLKDGQYGSTGLGETSVTLPRTPRILDGVISTSGQTVTWAMPWLERNYTQRLTIDEIQVALLPGALLGLFTRARVHLLGRMWYASTGASPAGDRATAGGISSTLYLDGQTFGVAGTRGDGSNRVDLQLPSGGGAAGSDFESWFYLAPVLTINTLSINPSAVDVLRGEGLPIIAALNSWTQVTPYAVGTQILGPDTQVLQVTRAGTSGKEAPRWPTAVGAMVQDGSVVWQVVAPPTVTPQGTVTFNYPAIEKTSVSLSISGGTAEIVTIPASVPVPVGSATVTFPVTVNANPGSTETFTIVAALPDALGGSSTQVTTFTVTGFTT